MKIQLIKLSVAALLVAGFVSNANAQTTGSQTFTVTVPQAISITAPTAAATLTHNETNAPQTFTPQTWVVRGNAKNGVNVTFETATPFVNVDDASYKRDAKLDLAVGSKQGSANWVVGVGSDSTNYATNDGVAQVTVASDGVGRANLNLTVSFITEEFGLFAAGDYVTTVTGTVAAR